MFPNSVPTWGRHSRRPTAGTSRQASCHRRALSCCGGSASQVQKGRHNVLWGKACTNLLELAGSLHLHIAGHHLVDTATHAWGCSLPSFTMTFLSRVLGGCNGHAVTLPTASCYTRLGICNALRAASCYTLLGLCNTLPGPPVTIAW